MKLIWICFSTGSSDLGEWQQYEDWTGAGIQKEHTITANTGQDQERTAGKPGSVSFCVPY